MTENDRRKAEDAPQTVDGLGLVILSIISLIIGGAIEASLALFGIVRGANGAIVLAVWGLIFIGLLQSEVVLDV